MVCPQNNDGWPVRDCPNSIDRLDNPLIEILELIAVSPNENGGGLTSLLRGICVEVAAHRHHDRLAIPAEDRWLVRGRDVTEHHPRRALPRGCDVHQRIERMLDSF